MKILRSVGLVIVLIVTFAGTWTTHQFMYKPDSVGKGHTEKNDFDSGLNRVDARLAYEVWLGDPGGSPGYDTLAHAITTIGSNPVVLRLPAGTVSITTDTTIPANITLAPVRGAILSIAATKTLTINGGLDAGLYQIFSLSGTGKVVFGAGAVAALYPQWWGAKGDGVTDDGAAIIAACAAVVDAGVKTIKFLNGNYRIYSVGTSYTNLGTFTGITGLCLISQGATLSIDPRRKFSNQFGDIFLLSGCHNVLIDGFNITGTSFNMAGKESVHFVRLIQGCSHINMPYNRIQGILAGLVASRFDAEPENYRSSNINIGLLEANQCAYGVALAFSGDDLNAGLLKTNGCWRSYIVYGVKNQKLTINSKDPQKIDAYLLSWNGHGIENLDLTYINTETTASQPDAHRIELAWDSVAGVHRNINIKLNSVYKNSGITGASTLRIIKYDKPYDEGLGQDTVDHGHRLENLTVSGYISGIPSTVGTAPINTAPGCRWGLSGTPDVWNNIKFENLRIDGSSIQEFFTGALQGFLTLNNVSSPNSPWWIWDNYNRVNPAGKVIATGCVIPNLYKKTGTDNHAILTIYLSEFAKANTYTLSPKESGKIVSSYGVTETTTVNLPAAVPGLEYTFERVGTGAMRIQPLGGDYIVGGRPGKYVILDSLGTTICLRCGTDGLWQIKSAAGTYAFQH